MYLARSLIIERQPKGGNQIICLQQIVTGAKETPVHK